MYQQKPKKITMRDRASDDTRPPFVRGRDATPQEIGGNDDVSWAIAEEFEKFFIKNRIATGKNAAWFFKAGQRALDKSVIREEYSRHPDRFRDGTGKKLTLAEFGRKMVAYFEKHSSWEYASGPEDVIGMFYDPVMLDECARGLWRVYRDRRIKRGK